MHQRLPIALAQAKVGNISENLLNEMCQTFSVSRKKITEKFYNNIMNSVKV